MIILEDDYHPTQKKIIELGKKIGETIIAEQRTLIADAKESAEWVDIINTNTKLPKWLPLKRKIITLRKILGHFLKYRNFSLNSPSYILRNAFSGLGNSDIQTYLCEEQKKLFIKNGVNPDKLVYYPRWHKKKRTRKNKIVTILLPSEIMGGVDRTTKKFIPYKDQIFRWSYLIRKAVRIFKGWRIYVKFHPDTKNAQELELFFKGLGKNISCFHNRSYAEKCIREASVIIGFPPSFSTLLYQASVEYPYKKILSIDWGNEMFGDYFRGYKNIIYEKIDTKNN